jgi:hypothetical protein
MAELVILARSGLTVPRASGPRDVLVLEGPVAPAEPSVTNLDDLLDARWAWIDDVASQLTAEYLQRLHDQNADAALVAECSVLRLRYELVKLLRPLAYLTERPPEKPYRHVIVAAERGLDEALVLALQVWATGQRLMLHVHWSIPLAKPPDAPVPNERWRRWLSQLDALWPKSRGKACVGTALLTGQPCLLDDVCRELVKRRWQVTWLWDRFHVGCAQSWWTQGVHQVTCNAPRHIASRPALRSPEVSLLWREIDLGPAVDRWLTQQAASRARWFFGLRNAVERHFDQLRPSVLVVDEDVSPLQRLAVLEARRRETRSIVVQHGLPAIQFGFAPLAADRIAVWGNASRDRLTSWGIPPERIIVTGTAKSLPTPRTKDQGPGTRPRILILATVPPRVGRPDSVAYHWTQGSAETLWRTLFRTLAQVPHASLVVRPHPRATSDPIYDSVAAEFPQLKPTADTSRSLDESLFQCDWVISCASGSGVEAAWAGKPVVQLMPVGSAELIEPSAWGLAASVRTEDELRAALDRLAAGDFVDHAQSSNVLAHTGALAAEAIAEAITQPVLIEKQRQAA